MNEDAKDILSFLMNSKYYKLILKSMADNKPRTIADIARAVDSYPEYIGKCVKKLEQKGLMECLDVNKYKMIPYRITEKGIQILPQI